MPRSFEVWVQVGVLTMRLSQIHYHDGVGRRHIDTARYYQNEDQVGQAVRQSGLPREEVFVSKSIPLRAVSLPEGCANSNTASKVYNQDQGYESTFRAVDDSLKNFGYDKH